MNVTIPNIIFNMTTISNRLVVEKIATNLNYNPLIFINFLFITILHFNIMLDFSQRLLKIDKFWFNLIFSTSLFVVNIFYFFTHFFPALGFYI